MLRPAKVSQGSIKRPHNSFYLRSGCYFAMNSDTKQPIHWIVFLHSEVLYRSCSKFTYTKPIETTKIIEILDRFWSGRCLGQIWDNFGCPPAVFAVASAPAYGWPAPPTLVKLLAANYSRMSWWPLWVSSMALRWGNSSVRDLWTQITLVRAVLTLKHDQN